jgi:hypothetical protein
VVAHLRNAVEVAAIEDVVGELEGEGKLDGGDSVAKMIRDEAARVFVAEFLEIPNDRADQVGTGFLVVFERGRLSGALEALAGLIALMIPRCDEGFVDNLAQSGLVGRAESAFLVERLEGGSVDATEDEVDGLRLSA